MSITKSRDPVIGAVKPRIRAFPRPWVEPALDYCISAASTGQLSSAWPLTRRLRLTQLTFVRRPLAQVLVHQDHATGSRPPRNHAVEPDDYSRWSGMYSNPAGIRTCSDTHPAEIGPYNRSQASILLAVEEYYLSFGEGA